MRIASVEDDKSQSELIQQILVSAGHECECFASGSTFLRALREQAFDLLVVDWQLPDTSGLEVVTWVRQNSGRNPHPVPDQPLAGRGHCRRAGRGRR